MTEPLLSDAALKAMGLLIVGSFVTGLGVLLKVNTISTILLTPETGVVPRLEKLREDFDELARYVYESIGKRR